jgi:hypothetical protein
MSAKTCQIILHVLFYMYTFKIHFLNTNVKVEIVKFVFTFVVNHHHSV